MGIREDLVVALQEKWHLHGAAESHIELEGLWVAGERPIVMYAKCRIKATGTVAVVRRAAESHPDPAWMAYFFVWDVIELAGGMPHAVEVDGEFWIGDLDAAELILPDGRHQIPIG